MLYQSIAIIIKSGIAIILFFLAFSLCYVAVAFFCSRIPVNGTADTSSGDIVIFISTNGVHTDIIVPVHHPAYDWSAFLSPSHCLVPQYNASYISFGWGDKGFYLDTPAWSDLTFSTAFKAAFGLSTSAMHVTWFENIPAVSESVKKIVVSEQEYRELCDYILKSFQVENNKPIHIQTTANYGNNDAFYDAHRIYSLFFTCNTWANSALKQSGQKAALWTPFDKGIFYHYR